MPVTQETPPLPHPERGANKLLLFAPPFGDSGTTQGANLNWLSEQALQQLYSFLLSQCVLVTGAAQSRCGVRVPAPWVPRGPAPARCCASAGWPCCCCCCCVHKLLGVGNGRASSPAGRTLRLCGRGWVGLGLGTRGVGIRNCSCTTLPLRLRAPTGTIPRDRKGISPPNHS